MEPHCCCWLASKIGTCYSLLTFFQDLLPSWKDGEKKISQEIMMSFSLKGCAFVFFFPQFLFMFVFLCSTLYVISSLNLLQQQGGLPGRRAKMSKTASKGHRLSLSLLPLYTVSTKVTKINRIYLLLLHQPLVEKQAQCPCNFLQCCCKSSSVLL